MNRRALVTGATAGLGAQFARQLAARGHDLTLVARDADRLASSAAELHQRFGVAAEVLSADLATDDGCDLVADRLSRGDVDLLVNNAGIGLYRLFGEASLADEERMLDLNVRAVMRLSHAAVRAMLARGGGEIVNVSSVAGFVPRGGNVTYAASKAWVTSFSEALAVRLAGTPVRVTAVCPGFVHTEFHRRASADMSHVPKWMWLDAEVVVRACLADARRGRPISVPSRRYKALIAAARHLPRPLLRMVMSRSGY